MTRPFLRMVGGKAWFRKHARRYIEPGTFTRYNETCIGGGAVFLELAASGVLSGATSIIADLDLNRALIWAAVRDNPVKLARDLRRIHESAADIGAKEFFAMEKDNYNLTPPRSRNPASTLWLMWGTYSGLWRHSLAGKMNVSSRSEEELLRLPLPDEEHLVAVSKLLQGVSILHRDVLMYDASGDLQIGEGDVMYIDPPYAVEFRQYQPGGFDDESQVALIQNCAEWANAGAQILYSQADTPKTRAWIAEYWPDTHIETVFSPRTVNSDTKGRGKVPELLVSTHLPYIDAEPAAEEVSEPSVEEASEDPS